MSKIAFHAVLLVLALPAPVLAQDRAPDVQVAYGDLNLSNAQDVRTLDRRLTRAVKTACLDDGETRELSELRAIALCRTAKRAEIAPLRQRALAAAQDSDRLAAAR
jgi:UrcA family protein